jgi:Branched-chain amino acid aminotransferase/4-amino-4-deoxychorismate lyase
MSFFIYNDKLYKEGTSVIAPDNRSLKYGDGLFETLKVDNGVIQLLDYHFERLFSGMKTLQFEIPAYFTAGYLANKIIKLSKKNRHDSFARARLMVFRGNGNPGDLKNNLPNYIIQSYSIDQFLELNSEGVILGMYADAKKSCDVFANFKTNNFLPYSMAAFYAKKINVDDCIVINQHSRICDTSIANIFTIKTDIIYTPPLSEGCIAGVMRRFIIEKFQNSKFKVVEKPLSVEDVKNADEVFLSNSIRGIRWVKQFCEMEYGNQITKQIHSFIREELTKKN